MFLPPARALKKCLAHNLRRQPGKFGKFGKLATHLPSLGATVRRRTATNNDQDFRKNRGQMFLVKSLPGSCLTNLFISKLNKATETAELGNPLLRIASSIAVSRSVKIS